MSNDFTPDDRKVLTIVADRQKRLENDMRQLITRAEFIPVKLIAFGMAGGVLVTVLGAVLRIVLVE